MSRGSAQATHAAGRCGVQFDVKPESEGQASSSPGVCPRIVCWSSVSTEQNGCPQQAEHHDWLPGISVGIWT